MKVVVGSDHGGFSVKETVRSVLAARGVSVEDVGCYGSASVDYTDYARQVALQVSRDPECRGVLACTTGIGMTIAANKFPGVRAALCLTPEMARLSRTHNDANVIVLSGAYTTPADAERIIVEWIGNDFSEAPRHQRRLVKLRALEGQEWDTVALREQDPEICAAVEGEWQRQQDTVNLIASENYASRAVREAQASVLTNKYAEGYPNKRWYNGCKFSDDAESLALARAGKLFGADHANVQAHCGSSANMAAYFSVLQPGDAILAMNLSHGGHLTHGNPVNFSGRLFRVLSYGVRRDTELIDYDEVLALAREHKPKMIVAGASAYSRTLDFPRFQEIAREVNALLLVDMAHIAGLVAAGCHPSPVPYADFVTSTTHKTLRGPRSGMILCRSQYAEAVDRQIFPGIQGGPLMHTIAAKAVCFGEALREDFKRYGQQVVRNAKVMAESLQSEGLRLVSGGTENHLMLVDLSSMGISGRDAATALEKVGVVVNKNAIPFDTKSPMVTSGIRLGTPSITTRGMKEAETRTIAKVIVKVLRNPEDAKSCESARRQIQELCSQFPVL